MPTNTSSSIPASHKAPPILRKEEFAAFDALPRELRSALHSTPLPVSAISVYKTWRRHPNETLQLAQAIHDFAWDGVYTFPIAPNYPKLERQFPPTRARAHSRAHSRRG